MENVIILYFYLTESIIYERKNIEESVNNETEWVEPLNSYKFVHPLSKEEEEEEEENSPILEENKTNINTSPFHDAGEITFSELMDACKDVSTENPLRPRITFLDFAGQSMYYAFQQIYFSPKTCYILVVDMTKKPGGVVESDVKCCSLFESWTYKGIKTVDTSVWLQCKDIMFRTRNKN